MVNSRIVVVLKCPDSEQQHLRGNRPALPAFALVAWGGAPGGRHCEGTEMMRRWIILFLLAIAAAAQDSSPDPTFRTGTELVQVSVVAQDQNGKAVEGLHRKDFQVFDNRAQQEIRLFLEEKPTPAQEVAKLPAGVFTNHIATDGATGYSVLLFDNLNIDSGQDVFTYT